MPERTLGMRGVNITNFLRRRLYQDFGMKELIERFYNSIRTEGHPPIPYREIIVNCSNHGRNLRSDLLRAGGARCRSSANFRPAKKGLRCCEAVTSVPAWLAAKSPPGQNSR